MPTYYRFLCLKRTSKQEKECRKLSHAGFYARVALCRFASAIFVLFLAIRALALSIDHLFAIRALVTPFAGLAVEDGTFQTAFEAHIHVARNIVALSTAVPFGVYRPLEALTRRAAGAVLLVSAQTEDAVGTLADQASFEASILPCHTVSVDFEVVANIFHWDLLGVGEVRMQKKSQADERKEAHDYIERSEHE